MQVENDQIGVLKLKKLIFHIYRYLDMPIDL